jgi:RNA polymerase sigma-70 factor (ECF subfamily)
MGEDSHLHLEIYETYFEDVYQYLLYFTNNQQEAEDLTQETFIRVFKAYRQFEYQSKVKTWIFSIAKHVAIDHYRKINGFLFYLILHFFRERAILEIPSKK